MPSVHKNKQEVPNHKRKRSITINTILEEKLREIQSQLIGSTKTSWSLSMIVNVLITSGLLALDKLSREDFHKIKYFIESDKVAFDNKAIRDYVVQIIKD
ncbi:MAG: hypothetical protein AUI61_00265 [Thaumarchaeota archaeon 13_1_40CM_2_39_13_2]|nr:MAG: hypothetical protein AUI61_00265 [Thaumarchaeota archaeon 13_1_40CM_2_39_13_2]OLE40770.1 MAG: hypothetical protein AUG16_02740 [Thaumarchaeota archaeon 13_1_20CM_2_39_20]